MQMSRFKRICVFCGSSQGKKSSYQDAAVELGNELVLHELQLIFFYFFSTGGYDIRTIRWCTLLSLCSAKLYSFWALVKHSHKMFLNVCFCNFCKCRAFLLSSLKRAKWYLTLGYSGWCFVKWVWISKLRFFFRLVICYQI